MLYIGFHALEDRMPLWVLVWGKLPLEMSTAYTAVPVPASDPVLGLLSIFLLNAFWEADENSSGAWGPAMQIRNPDEILFWLQPGLARITGGIWGNEK